MELKSAIGPAPELADAADPAPGIDEDQSAPVIDEAPGEPETLLDLIDRSREQIAVAAGISADRVRIIVEF
nr:hypothetical protein [Sphingopyxis sp. H053]